MRIKLGNRNNLFTFRDDEGRLSSINLADYSGRVNFRRIVRNYLKEEGIFVSTRRIARGAQQFFAYMKKPLTAVDILKIALKVERE